MKAIFFFSILIIYKHAAAQTCDTAPYRHVYYNKDYIKTQVKNFSFASGNDIYLIGSVNKDSKNSNVDAWLMRTTYHGTPLWSKAIGTNADETINSIKKMTNKDYIFSGVTKYNSKYASGWLMKTDSLGNVLWSLKLNSLPGSLRQVEELNNGDVVVAGTLYLQFSGDASGNVTNIIHSTNFIMRFDKNGKIIWQRSFYNNSKELLIRVQQIADGNLLAAGIVLNSKIAYILKIDQHTGGIIWMNEFEKPDNYNYTQISEMNDGSIYFKSGNRVYFFDKAGKFKTGSYEIRLTLNGRSVKGGQIQSVGAIGTNEIYYADIKPYPILFCVKNNSTVLWAHIYNLSSSGELALGGSRVFNNNIYLSGSYNASSVSDSTSGEQMAYLLKTSIQGEASCVDTADISFSITNILPENKVIHSWIDEGVVTAEFIPVYTKNIEPVRLLNCTQHDCCNDMAVTINDKICDNSSYELPDGIIVTKPGFYTSRMNTSSGCDSIIYTILAADKKVNLTLSSDTCMKDNQPVVFSLPQDSSVRYYWNDGAAGNKYIANFPGTYWVSAISGCYTITDSVKVHNNCRPAIFIPSAFTPNNDGLNDIFRVPALNGQHLANFSIYNRLGELIFISNNPFKGWDGTINNVPQPLGTYIYVLNYFDLAGKSQFLKGTVVLIR